MKSELSTIGEYRQGKVDVDLLTVQTYISTENMLPNKGGITKATSLPTVPQTQQYKQGDVLVSNIRPYFKKIWKATCDGGCSNDVLVFSAKAGVNSDFLYYVLSDDSFFDYSMATSKGTKMPRGDKSSIMRYQIPALDIDTQRKIASVLCSIDEKIKVNKEINDNLEQQASALIEDYCASTESTVELGQILSFENGFAFQSSTYLPAGSFRIITIKNVQDGRIDSQGAAFIEQIPDRMKPGCVLLIGDVLLSLTGNVGRVGIVCEEKLLLNQRVAKFIPKDPNILPWLYYYFRLPSSKVTLESIAKGTAQQNLSPVETLKLQVPFESSIALDLSKNLQPMFNQEIAGFMESIRLAAIRDALLPKLMSGELDVSDVEL